MNKFKLNRLGMKPLYCPYRSGYLSLIFQVQQLGITRLITGGRLHTYWICCKPRHGALLQVPLETF